MDFFDEGQGSLSQSGVSTIVWRIPEWFPQIPLDKQEMLKAFFQELLIVNKEANLVSPKTILVADALLFADSILASRALTNLVPNMTQIYDFSSGIGFPGLVFAILNSNVSTVLVEMDPKKCDFLKRIISLVGLKNVELKSQGIESFKENSISLAMVKSSTSITKTIMSARKLMPKGATLYHLKGEEWVMEVSEIPTQLCSIWSPSLVSDYKLPIGSLKFSIIKTEKLQ